jgi:hypothetical protein
MMLWLGFRVSTSIVFLLKIVARPQQAPIGLEYPEVSSVQGSSSPAKA